MFGVQHLPVGITSSLRQRTREAFTRQTLWLGHVARGWESASSQPIRSPTDTPVNLGSWAVAILISRASDVAFCSQTGLRRMVTPSMAPNWSGAGAPRRLLYEASVLRQPSHLPFDDAAILIAGSLTQPRHVHVGAMDTMALQYSSSEGATPRLMCLVAMLPANPVTHLCTRRRRSDYQCGGEHHPKPTFTSGPYQSSPSDYTVERWPQTSLCLALVRDAQCRCCSFTVISPFDFLVA